MLSSNSGVLGFGSVVLTVTCMGDWYSALLFALYVIYLLLKRQLGSVLLPVHISAISAIVRAMCMDMVILINIFGEGVHTRKLGPQLRLTKIQQPEWKVKFFAQTGVRWSELLCLPYFDPTRFVVIDTMHNLFLSLINKHFQDILGIRLEKDLEQDAPVFDLAFSDRWTRAEQRRQKARILTHQIPWSASKSRFEHGDWSGFVVEKVVKPSSTCIRASLLRAPASWM